MNLVVRGKNIEVPANARDYVAKKVSRFDHHIKEVTEIKVELSEEKRSKGNHYVVEMTINSQGTLLRCEEKGPDVFTAIDAAANVMDRQISRYKERLQKRKTRSASPEAKDEDIKFENEGTPLKVKRFPIKPMSPEEAIEQMELLGHDFFMFFNNISEQLNVVYRRKNGNYGLIEPEID